MNRTFLGISAAMALLAASCQKMESSVDCTAEIKVIPSLEETKASLIPAGDLTDYRIHIDGYIHDSTTDKHLDANILYDTTIPAWSFYNDTYLGIHYYWPQSEKHLDFLAYAPADLTNTFVSIETFPTVQCSNLPMTREDQAGSNLNEFVCGYAADKKEGDGTVSIEMKRPFALVHFNLDESVRSTLNSITIKDLYNIGTYNAATGVWSDLSNKTDLVFNVNKKYPEEINGGSLGDPMVVIPQSLRVGDTDEVKLVFSYKSYGNTGNTVTETTIGKAKIESASEALSSWIPGKMYEYWLALNGAANEIRMTVTVRDWSIQGTEEIDVK